MALTPKERRAALAQGRVVDLSPDAPQFQKPKTHDPHKIFSKAAPPEKPLPADRRTEVPPADGRPSVITTGRPEVLPADRRPLPTADRRTVVQGNLGKPLPADRGPVVTNSPPQEIPLAPVQWRVWEAISQAEEESRVISRRALASVVKATVRGVRDALSVIETAGGILSKETVRTATEQGIRFTLDRSVPFRQASRKETFGITKRDSYHRPTVDGRTVALPADGRLSMSVCKRNTYIQSEDIKELLHIPPQSWQIREATVIKIADMFPTMNATVFRLSLRQAVEQAQSGKKKVQNPNAWLKAAFEQNGGPLITERDIEARLAGNAAHTAAERLGVTGQADDADMETLQRYMAASGEERDEIDLLAAEQAKPALDRVGADKHDGIMLQARIEAAREYFHSQETKG